MDRVPVAAALVPRVATRLAEKPPERVVQVAKGVLERVVRSSRQPRELPLKPGKERTQMGVAYGGQKASGSG
jgi:hypothetical protein